MTKSSIMIDIDDPRSDKIADAISNKTSKKVLGLLSDGEMSGSEIAEKLGIALNTVTYNLKKLYEAGLIVKSSRVFWSSKGKRMEIYRLSDKRIVISPRRMVRGIVPALIVSILIASIIALSGFDGTTTNIYAENNALQVKIGEDAVGVASSESGSSAVEERTVSDGAIMPPEREFNDGGYYGKLERASNIWAWYLIGALTALLVLLLWNIKRNERRSD
jgi:DNA-binding transcriptional ArsR family regulator